MFIDEIYQLTKSILFFGGGIAIVGLLLSPFQFLKVIHQETKEGYIPIFKKYYNSGNWKAFIRGGPIYALRQFMTNMAFGIAQYLYLKITNCYTIQNLLIIIALQAVLGSLLETSITVFGEAKEIEKNKGELMKAPPRVIDIMNPLLVRNGIAWLASVTANEVTKAFFDGNIPLNILICCITGLLAATCSLPFDLVATKNCGAAVKVNFLVRLVTIFKEEPLGQLFSGLRMRIIQTTSYTILNSLLMYFFKQI